MMSADRQPAVGAWYETEDGEIFKVLAVNASTGAVDVQYVSGRVETLPPEVWLEMPLIEIEPLEEWHASMDDFLAGRRRKEKE